ncbi:inhibitory regulator protein ira1-related [Anaeramoeba flamelloides]|uniref:Inhibitory regulator protein ira1-related n=1 Tax=Anaeramoeba flamelloides TaxID=1746091 RepID=A0ABQ8XAV9_9EUKA|nr:inhibitory regulator protein ira1-related [Anaeramoeba flamelloides]
MQTHGQMLKAMCQRVNNFLPIFTHSTYCSTCVVFVPSEFLEQTIPHERETIVTFSKTRLESVLLILGKFLGKLTEKHYSPQDIEFEKLEQSILIVMELLIQSLEGSFKMSFETIRNFESKFKKKIVSDQIANELTKIIYNIHFMREHDYFTEMIHKYCGLLFTRISHANYEVVYSRVNTLLEKIQNKLTEEFKSNELKLIQHLDYGQKTLSELLTKITLLAGDIPKLYQIPIVNVVRKGIWNWIDYHPEQFTEFYRSGKKMKGNPEILFQKILDWSKSAKKKLQYQYWPLLTMLLVLCPKIILQIGTNNKTTLKSSTGKFVNELKKSFSGKDQKKMQTSAQCLIDFCKAATYVAKSDNTGLRLIVPNIQELLITKLMNQKKLIITNVDLLVEFLVSAFRLTPEITTKEHYNACLHPNSSPILKLVLVKSFVRIAQETPLEWNPTIEQTYSRAVDVKQIFYEYLDSLRRLHTSQLALGKTGSLKSVTNNPNIKKKEREQMELANKQMMFVEESLKLFSADPDFALVAYAIDNNKEKKLLSGEIKILFTTLPQCIDNSLSNEITHEGINFIKVLHKSEYIVKWGSNDKIIETFFHLNSMALYIFANQIIDTQNLSQEKIVLWLNLLLDILRKRNKFLISHLKNEVLSGRIKLTHDQANTRIENALLMLLCNSDPIIVTQAVECIDCLCQELKLLNEINDPKNTIAASYQNYKKMYQMGRYVTSRIAQQKNIRSLFRRIETATTGNIPSWTKIHQKWGEKSERILKFERMIEFKSDNVTKSKKLINLDDYDQNLERLEWENDLGFLISLAAVAKKIVLRSTISESNDRTNVASNSSSGGKTGSGSEQVVIGTFLDYLLELTVSDITYIRGTVIKIITQMSTSVYYIFFKKIQELIKNDFKIWVDGRVGIFEKAKKSQIAVRFLDQIIFVLRGILEQPLTMDDLADVEIENLFITMTKAISRFVVDIQNFTVKIKMCKLITILMEKKDYILFKRELMFRNELTELIMEWFSDFQKKTISKSKTDSKNTNKNESMNETSTNSSFNNSGNTLNEKSNLLNNQKNSIKEAKKLKKLINEVDLFAMEAITKLLIQLPLQKPWVGKKNQPTGEEILEQKSNLFYQYFTFFTQLLSRLRGKSTGLNNNNSNNKNKNKNNNSISEEEKKLSQLTVIALSNMLHSNVNVGLHHTLPMGYVKNLKTRSEFLDVFTNILKQGTEFGNLKETLEDKYRNLIEMILDKDLIVTKSICDIIKVTEMDLLAGILIRINRTRNSDIELLKFMIETEVANNPIDQPSTLFRRNSFASKMMSAYSRAIGKQYLKKTLSDLIQTTINDIMVNKKGIEIDERKLKQEENLDENLKNLLELTQVYFNKIMNSLINVPISFYKISNILKATVERKFKNCTNIVIAGFFFLRFICPAIISPENANLVKERIPVEVRRALILIAKALQNLANGVMFGEKEKFMIPLNKFIEENKENFNQLVIQLSNANYLDNLNNSQVSNNLSKEALKEKEKPNNSNENNEETQGEDGDEINDEEISSSDLNSLHKFLYLNLQNLSVYFKRLKDSNQVKKGESFVTILTQLGKPSDIQQKQKEEHKANNQNLGNNENVETGSKKKSDKLYQKFIQTMKGKENELQQFNDIIYHKGTSKKNESVIYAINRKIMKDNCDYQLLLYHILVMIKPLINKPYIIVLDLTNFTKDNEIPKYWCNQFLKHIPYGWSNNLQQIIVLNPSTQFKRYFKTINSIIPNKLNKSIKIIKKPSELTQYILPNQMNLPEETNEFESSIISTYENISQQLSRVKTIKINFQISNNFLQIIQLKENLFNQNCNLIDFIHISNIKSINKTINTQDQFILDMIIDNEQKNINYKSSQFVNEIVHSINTMKEKYNFSQKTSQKKNKKKIPEIRPSDVPGSLLNIALVNLGSQSENLRKSSYNLLTALCNSFRFTMSGEMLEAEGLSIPQSHTSFVVNLSKAIAQNEKHITLEFLYEAIKHYNEASSEGKHLCLEYVSPWLVNLTSFLNIENNDKFDENDKNKVDDRNKDEKENKKLFVKKIIVNLLKITLQENKLYPAILVHIWKSISLVIELFELVLDIFIEQSVEFGINTIKSERIAQIVVTVSSNHPEIFSKLICKKLLNCFFLASHQEIKTTIITTDNNNITVSTVEKGFKKLEDYEKWNEILILTRFLLYLSFENLVSLENNLPDIFHFIINTHWANSYYLRSWLFSLAINILHSLSTKLPPKREKDYENLVKLLKEISDTRFRMLFTGSGLKQNEILTNKNQNLIPQNLSEIPIESTEKITQLFCQVLRCYKNDTELYNKWQNKWLQLTTESTFDNSVIQCRSYVILGVITVEEVKSKFIEKILSHFGSLFGNLDFTNQNNRDLCSSILISLTHLYPLIEKESDLLFTMFWLPIILFELGDHYYFSHALDMLNVILNYLDEQQVFDENSLETVFMTVRNDDQTLDKSLTKLEKTVGINFHTHFSFALTSLLLQSKGNSTVKVKMISIFRKIIEISCKTQLNYHLSPYIVGLATCLGRKELSELREFLRNYIDWEGEFEQLIFSPIMEHDNTSATLLVALLTSILVQSDYEQEHQYILELLTPSIDSFPTVYPTIQHHFLPKLFQIIDRTLKDTVHHLALNLSFSLLSNEEPLILNFMEKLQFNGIFDLVSEKNKPETIRSKRKLIPDLLSLLF